MLTDDYCKGYLDGFDDATKNFKLIKTVPGIVSKKRYRCYYCLDLGNIFSVEKGILKCTVCYGTSSTYPQVKYINGEIKLE